MKAYKEGYNQSIKAKNIINPRQCKGEIFSRVKHYTVLVTLFEADIVRSMQDNFIGLIIYHNGFLHRKKNKIDELRV